MVSTLGAGLLRQPLLFWGTHLRTYIYIDGFNFYYGAVKDTPYKWLDFKLLFTRLLKPHHQILSIKYFTARVSGKLDPDQPIRQKTFLRALEKHIPELSVYYGQFNSHPKALPLAQPIKTASGKTLKYAHVIKTEEKGSDVNLAVQLLNDAWLDRYDCAIIVSNDGDLRESLRIVREGLNKNIGLLTPWRYSPLATLRKYCLFVTPVRKRVLAACQLPDPIPGTSLRKPSVW